MGSAKNPKDAIGGEKVPLSLVPSAFKVYTALGLAEGALKYGRWNFRASPVVGSIYLDALERHIEKYKNGQWADDKTGVPHLANAAASLAILIDATEQGTLIDDRPPMQNILPDLIDETGHGLIIRLKDLFKSFTPRHWTQLEIDKERSNGND